MPHTFHPLQATDQDMATQDLYSEISVKEALAAKAYTSSTNGTSIDTLGFESATFSVQASAYTDGTHEFEVQEAADDGAGSPDTWANASSEDLLFDNSQAQVDDNGKVTVDAGGDVGVYHVGYRGDKRHVRVNYTATSTTTGAELASQCVLGHARDNPTNA